MKRASVCTHNTSYSSHCPFTRSPHTLTHSSPGFNMDGTTQTTTRRAGKQKAEQACIKSDDRLSTPNPQKRKVRFSGEHLHHETYSPSDYDRTSSLPTRGRLSAGGYDAAQFKNEVRKDLVIYKLDEMEVHDESRDNIDLSLFREETRRQIIRAKLAELKAAAAEPEGSNVSDGCKEEDRRHCEGCLGFHKVGSRLDSWIQWQVSKLGFEIS
jgi:hypothetical protein